MRSIVILVLLATALAEKKINLEDIERDNLRSEIKSTALSKAESDSQNYQYPGHPGLGSYTTEPTGYGQADTYSQNSLENDVSYQKDANQQYEYAQIQVIPKSFPQSDYQQVYHEPQVSVGNQYQTIQQKAATAKYVTNLHKGTVYIPMSQLLAYYPHLTVGQGAKAETVLHNLATQAAQQIPVPVYKPVSRTASVYTPKLTYQLQPQYVTYATPQHTEAIFPSKSAARETQYLQEFVYTPYTEPSQASTYAGVPLYVQDSVTHVQLGQYSHYDEPKRYQVPTKPVYRTQIQHVKHQYQKAPSQDFTPPQLPEQNFKSDVYAGGESDQQYLQNHIDHVAEPKSLLDSYVPSHIIAAADEAKYRERPIKLEGGFLPSKINFVHSYKKRKSQ